MRILPNVLAVYLSSCTFSGCGDSSGTKKSTGTPIHTASGPKLPERGRHSREDPSPIRSHSRSSGPKYPLVDPPGQVARNIKEAGVYYFLNPKHRGSCPSKYLLAVQDEGSLPLLQAPTALATGTGTSIFKLGEKYAVKFISDYTYDVAFALITEREIMSSMMEQPGGPEQYGIANIYEFKETSRVPEDCKVRMLVTDLLPGTSLMERVRHGTRPLDERSILKIAANALEALRKFHTSGFAHGDIEAGNFMVHEKSPGEFSVRLIDLGKVKPFVYRNGSHVAPRKFYSERLDADFDYRLLSPWHIEYSWPATYASVRRDDLFRLAETMFRVSSERFMKELSNLSSRADISEFKRKAAAAHGVGIHESLVRFYTYTLGLGFDEEPDYAKWIAEFNR
jgi:serine/threonine protein kinase